MNQYIKKTFLTITLLAGICAASVAQCNKKVVLTSSKTDHLNAAGTVTRTVDESAIVEISKTRVDITVNNGHEWGGTINADTCNWKVPFKEGKTVIKALLTNDNGQDKNVTITIEGKDGKVTLLFEMEGMPDNRIRVPSDKFEEKT